ncbi:hypothetical protein GIX45_29310 [Erwinia sp. CPCC 100877]|nr:hypothetical protein [Erwinia sp. CPCC 100877]
MKSKHTIIISVAAIFCLSIATLLYLYQLPMRRNNTFVCSARVVIKNEGYTLYTLLSFHLGRSEGVAALSGYLEDPQHRETAINRYIHFSELDRDEGKQLQSERIVPASNENVSAQVLAGILPDFFVAKGHLLNLQRTWAGENSMMILVAGFPAILCD